MRLNRTGTRLRSTSFVLLLAACFSVACGDGDARPRSTVVVGNGDHADNGVLSVDEPKIRGSIEDGTLSVDVPVTSLVDKDISGKLNLRLISVDGAKELGTVELPYELAAGASDTLTASLDAPPDLAAQSDLVG